MDCRSRFGKSDGPSPNSVGMSERDAIDAVDEPATVATLIEDIRRLGVEPGDLLLCHSSLQAIGWVCGDAPAVVDALMAAVTENGTVVVPTHTAQYTDPKNWSNPPVPDDWVETIRGERPAFRPAVTPTRSMGAIPECFRNYPEAVRSRHPIYSFAAWGEAAEEVVADHPFENGLGNDSPLGRCYERDGRVLMLGTGYETNTSIHLAEYRAAIPTDTVDPTVPVCIDGEEVRVQLTDIETSTDDFPTIGAAFEDAVPSSVTTGAVGAATATLIEQRALVDFAVDWLESNR